MKIRNKIIFLFMSITAITLLLLSIFVYIFTSHFANRNFYTRLKARASIAAQKHLEDESLRPFYEEVRRKHLLPLTAEKEFILPLDPNTNKVTDTHHLPLPPQFYYDLLKNRYAEYKKGKDLYVGLLYENGNEDFVVVMTANDEDGAELLASLRNLLIIGFIICWGLVFVGGLYFSRHILEPVSKIIQEVNRISASNLHLRLKQREGKDEISQLAGTFNNMLDRLESAFEMQSNFVSNASHELRTPLTTLLGESELILKRPRTPEQYVESLTIINHEANRLDQLITSLLKMSQLGFDGKKLAVETVRMDELLKAIKADMDRRIPDNKVVLELENLPANPDALQFSVNRMWIKLAIINIIHNGIKYSNNDEVRVKLTANDEIIEIKVTDLGIGIPAEDIVHVFEPFYRGSNTASFQGYGIGLPLSLKIIRLHNGKISINSEKNKGTTVRIQFFHEKPKGNPLKSLMKTEL